MIGCDPLRGRYISAAGPGKRSPRRPCSAEVRSATRARHVLPGEAVLFGYGFDPNSTAIRKNLMAALEAFQLAFPLPQLPATYGRERNVHPLSEHVALLIKTFPPQGCSAEWHWLQARAAEDSRIVLVAESLPRDELLARVLDRTRGNAAARSAEEGARLLAAEWAIDDRDAPRSLRLLADLPPGLARRTQALRLKLQASRLAQQPHEGLKTAHQLIKHQGLSKEAGLGMLRSLAIEYLESAHDIDQLRRVWASLDAADRRDVFVASRAAVRAARLGSAEDARTWLRPAWTRIETAADDERRALAHALVCSVTGIGVDWLPRLESARAAFPRDPAVAHAFGAVLAERQLWGKARDPLETAASHPDLPISSRRMAWLTLAELSQTEGHTERAAESYRQAATLG